MVGQHNLLKQIYNQIHSNLFPRFSIIVGEEGSEKNEIAHYIAKVFDATCVDLPDCKVETIRNMIVDAYKVKTLTVYNIKDADGMSLQARNSLLKVTEEPPNKAYFVMTLEDENHTLPTILSRGTVYELDLYTREELVKYCKEKYPQYSLEEVTLILSIATNPGEIDIISSYNPTEFYSFVTKVINNIATVSGANSFKIAQSLKMKDTDEKGYDLRYFFKAFCLVCMEKGYLHGLVITSRYLSKLRIKTVNRSMLFDKWILDIRKEWIDGGK